MNTKMKMAKVIKITTHATLGAVFGEDRIRRVD